MFQPLYLSTAVIEMCIYSRRKLRVTGIYGKPFKNRKNFCPKSELLKMWWNLIPRDSLEKSLSDPKWRNTWNQKCGDIFPNLCLSLFCLFCFDLSDFVLVFERERDLLIVHLLTPIRLHTAPCSSKLHRACHLLMNYLKEYLNIWYLIDICKIFGPTFEQTPQHLPPF